MISFCAVANAQSRVRNVSQCTFNFASWMPTHLQSLKFESLKDRNLHRRANVNKTIQQWLAIFSGKMLMAMGLKFAKCSFTNRSMAAIR